MKDDAGGNSPVIEVLLLGFGVGILVGLMGVGGGIVLVPALLYLQPGFSQHMAQGTSLLLQLPPIGIGALVFYWKRHRVDLQAGFVCAAGFLLGGYFGSDIALAIEKRHLQGLFGAFLMVAAMLLFRQAGAGTAPSATAGEDA